MLADADDDEGISYYVYPYNQDLGSKVISSLLDTDGEGEEEEGGGGGGGEVVTYETEFDLNKYIQRYIEIHITCTSQTSNLIGPEFIHGVTVYYLLEFLLLCITSQTSNLIGPEFIHGVTVYCLLEFLLLCITS